VCLPALPFCGASLLLSRALHAEVQQRNHHRDESGFLETSRASAISVLEWLSFISEAGRVG
jgi:hypothetical protein